MPTVDLLVGLDVGTTSSKAVVYRTDGTPLAMGRATTPWRRDVGLATESNPAGRTELDAHELLAAVRTALSRAVAASPDGRFVAIGVTSMAESGVLLDSHGEPVAPVIAWHDARDGDQVAALGREFGAESFSSRTGLPFRSQWSLTKHRWQMDNDPGATRAVRRLNIAEWIVRGLGGDEASDASLASRTGWLELTARTWWTESLDWSRASERLLPPLVTSGTALGRLSASAGLERLAGAVLTTAGHDHQAAALGAHAAGAGDQLDSCGTAEALVRTVPAGFPADGVSRLTKGGITVGWHVLDDRWALLGATEGGLALQRLASIFGGSREALAQLDTAAMESTRGTVTVAVDEAARVTIRGIEDDVTAGNVWRAALEEITEQIRTIHGSMTAVVGPHRNMVATGGWSKSEALMQVKRRAFGDLIRSEVEEAGARGAALLAGLAAGVYAGSAAFPDPEHSEMTEPVKLGRVLH